MRRRQATALFATALAAIAMAALAAPVGAQQFAAPLTITKVVVGGVPDDAVFIVTIECSDAIINDGVNPPTSSLDLEFGPDGGSTTFGFADAGDCVITEPEAGGATATEFACGGDVELCSIGGTNADIEVEFEDQNIEVTVTNTFETAPPEPEEAVEPIAAAPRFTG